jgi:hypothetical protein
MCRGNLQKTKLGFIFVDNFCLFVEYRVHNSTSRPPEGVLVAVAHVDKRAYLGCKHP